MAGSSVSAQTLDLIFEHVKDAPEKQVEDVGAIDAKFIQVFAAASVLLGAIALVDSKHGDAWGTRLTVVALALYLVMAVVSFIHLRPITLHGARYADTLWDDFENDEPAVLKKGIVLKVKEDYAYNRTLIEKKARTLKLGLALTAGEAVLVAIAVLISRLT